MDDYKISLGAILDANAKGDIDKQLSAIKDLSIKISKAELDQSAIDHIKQQLSKNGIDLKLVFGNSSQFANQAKQVGQQIVQQIQTGISSAIQKGAMENLKEFKFEGELLRNDVAKKALEDFKALGQGIVTVKEEMKNIDGNSLLNGFIINIKNVKGEIESLRYVLNDIDGKTGSFQYVGGSINDASAIKQIKDIENAFTDYTSKLAQFKSTNSEILSGLTTPLSDFENKLAGLKNGISTIDEVKNAYKALNTEASNITQNFSRQLSPIDSAIRNLAKGEETISGLRAEFKGLNNAPKEINSELNKCARLLENVKKIEAQEGRTEKWSQSYREWINSVESLQAKLNTLKKEQANNTSTQIFNTDDLDKQGKIYIQKVSNTIEKVKSALESKLRKAGYTDIKITGIEKANGQIKSLTASVTDATGAFKQLNFQREKIQGNGKAQYGFVQTDDVKVIGNLSSSVEKVQGNLTSLKTKWEEQGILVGEFKSKVEQLESSLSTVGSKGELNNLKAQIGSLKSEASNIESAIKRQESLTNAMAKGREQAELARRAEEQRQQLAQNNAINKALEEEYQERQKNIQVAQKQAELDKQNALAFTKSASERLSSAISKYSYGDTSDANAMMKQMNRGLSNFGDLSNVQGNIAQLSSIIDKIIADLKTSHEQSLRALNEEIKAEQTLQSQKDAFNKKNINAIDYEIQKREEQAKAFSAMLQEQMLQEQKLTEKTNKIQLSFDAGSYQSKVDSLVARTNQWVDANGSARISTESLHDALNNLEAAYNKLNSSGGNTVANQKALIESEKTLGVEIKKVQSSITSMNATMAKSSAIDGLRQKYQMFYDTNTAAHRKWGVQIKDAITELSSGAEISNVRFKELQNRLIGINNSARQAGKLGLSWFDTIKNGMKSFSYWTSSTFLVMKTITETKQAISTVKNLDDSLVDLRKTAKMTSSELEDFYYASNDVAKQMGVTTQEIISQAAAWSRLGFNTAEAATQMAKLSSQFKLISPGMTSEEATSGLVSIMKAKCMPLCIEICI